MPGSVPSVCVAGAERGRVGRGAGENAEHRRGIETREPADERRGHRAENDDRRSERIHLHPLLAQRGEETRAELQADREDKQDQPKLLHEIQRVMIDRLAEVPDEDARKQHARRAEADAAKLQAPERHAEHANDGNYADRVRDRLRLVQLEEPVHPIILPRFTNSRSR